MRARPGAPAAQASWTWSVPTAETCPCCCARKQRSPASSAKQRVHPAPSPRRGRAAARRCASLRSTRGAWTCLQVAGALELVLLQLALQHRVAGAGVPGAGHAARARPLALKHVVAAEALACRGGGARSGAATQAVRPVGRDTCGCAPCKRVTMLSSDRPPAGMQRGAAALHGHGRGPRPEPFACKTHKTTKSRAPTQEQAASTQCSWAGGTMLAWHGVKLAVASLVLQVIVALPWRPLISWLLLLLLVLLLLLLLPLWLPLRRARLCCRRHPCRRCCCRGRLPPCLLMRLHRRHLLDAIPNATSPKLGSAGAQEHSRPTSQHARSMWRGTEGSERSWLM